jgi:programmed cell death 6-interacting protein
MLSVSLKRTDEAFFGRGLKQYLLGNYSDEEVKRVEDLITILDTKRASIVQMSAQSVLDYKVSIEVFSEYLACVTMLAARFPFGDHKPQALLSFGKFKTPTVKVLVSWYGSFERYFGVKKYSSDLERGAMIFNIGALYSMWATTLLSQPDGLKESAKLYKKASDVFKYLKEQSWVTALSGDSPNGSQDFSVNGLNFLSEFMTAQYQACFYEQAHSKPMGNGTLAKLAASAESRYSIAHGLTETKEVKSMLATSEYPWALHVNLQQLNFQATADYWMADVKKSEEQYGLQVAHLRRASATCLKSTSAASKRNALLPKLLPSLVEGASILQNKIAANLSEAERYNDSIYLKSVPALDKLETVPPLAPTPAKQAEAGYIPRVVSEWPAYAAFDTLVPAEVAEGVKKLSERLDTLREELTRAMREDADYAKMHLASLHLPAALEAMGSGGVPDELWAKIREVQLVGGEAALAKLQQDVAHARETVSTMFTSVKQQLQSELEDDQKLRLQFGPRWNRRSSANITAGFQTEIEAIEVFLKQATAADAKVAAQLNEAKLMLPCLALTREELEARLPQGPSVQAQQDAPESQALGGLLDTLSAKLVSREQAVAMVGKKLAGLPLRTLLQTELKAGKTVERVAEELLAKFEQAKSVIAKLASDQRALLEQVTDANSRFVASRRQDETSRSRENFLQEWSNSVRAFDTLSQHCNEGLKFYLDLTSTKVEPLAQNVGDFCVARNIEKQLLLDQLTHSLANMASSSRPAPSYTQNPNQQLGGSSSLYGNASAPAAPSATSASSAPAPLDLKVSFRDDYVKLPPNVTQPVAANVAPQQFPSPVSVPFASQFGPAPGYSAPQQHVPQSNNNHNNSSNLQAPGYQPAHYAAPASFNSQLNPQFNTQAQAFQQPQYARPQFAYQGPPQSMPSHQPIPASTPMRPQAQSQAQPGYQAGYARGDTWACPACTYVNHVDMGRCEMCGSRKN